MSDGNGSLTINTHTIALTANAETGPIVTNPDIEDAEFETLGNDRARKTGASVAKTDAANVKKGMSLTVFTLVAVLASGVSFYAAGGHALISAS
ncbi:MAG: hypothetical protein AAFP99_11060, partial [Pseudomonadota bacterium]